MNDKQYVVFYGGRKVYHQLDKLASQPVRTLCGLSLNFVWDTLFPGIPLNRRLCKHCERVRAKQIDKGEGNGNYSASLLDV